MDRKPSFNVLYSQANSVEGSTSVVVIDISGLFVMEMFSNENETLTLKRKQTDGIVFIAEHNISCSSFRFSFRLNFTLVVGAFSEKIAFLATRRHLSWCSESCSFHY